MAFKTTFSVLLFSLLAGACQSGDKAETEKTESFPSADTIPVVDTGDYETKMRAGLPKDMKPLWGYRYEIEGDFNGDGKKETLKEHFVSRPDFKEINKFYANLTDYEQLVFLTYTKLPYSFLLSSDGKMDTLRITDGIQQLGLSFLKNEGDLNGDGTDEVSYVINWADWSSLNTWHIMSYRQGVWKEIYSFDIWDWQLPDVPETESEYGLFGKMNMKMEEKEQASPAKGQEPEFQGLVKKLGNKKIQVIYMNDDADMDTLIVQLD